MAKNPEDVFKEADEKIRHIVSRVLSIEKEYLFEKRPQGVADEILNVIRQEVAQ
jgi:hypothetical protein